MRSWLFYYKYNEGKVLLQSAWHVGFGPTSRRCFFTPSINGFSCGTWSKLMPQCCPYVSCWTLRAWIPVSNLHDPHIYVVWFPARITAARHHKTARSAFWSLPLIRFSYIRTKINWRGAKKRLNLNGALVSMSAMSPLWFLFVALSFHLEKPRSPQSDKNERVQLVWAQPQACDSPLPMAG